MTPSDFPNFHRNYSQRTVPASPTRGGAKSKGGGNDHATDEDYNVDGQAAGQSERFWGSWMVGMREVDDAVLIHYFSWKSKMIVSS